MGFLMGLVTTYSTMGSSDKVVSRLEMTLEKEQTLRRTLEIQTSTKISSLVEENRKLKSKTKTYKIIKPDGTIEERTSSEIESEETVSSTVRQEYEKKISEKIDLRMAEYEYRLDQVTKERKSLRIGAGMTTEMQWYGSVSYSIFPPIIVQFWGDQSGELALGFGIDL